MSLNHVITVDSVQLISTLERFEDISGHQSVQRARLEWGIWWEITNMPHQMCWHKPLQSKEEIFKAFYEEKQVVTVQVESWWSHCNVYSLTLRGAQTHTRTHPHTHAHTHTNNHMQSCTHTPVDYKYICSHLYTHMCTHKHTLERDIEEMKWKASCSSGMYYVLC